MRWVRSAMVSRIGLRAGWRDSGVAGGRRLWKGGGVGGGGGGGGRGGGGGGGGGGRGVPVDLTVPRTWLMRRVRARTRASRARMMAKWAWASGVRGWTGESTLGARRARG